MHAESPASSRSEPSGSSALPARPARAAPRRRSRLLSFRSLPRTGRVPSGGPDRTGHDLLHQRERRHLYSTGPRCPDRRRGGHRPRWPRASAGFRSQTLQASPQRGDETTHAFCLGVEGHRLSRAGPAAAAPPTAGSRPFAAAALRMRSSTAASWPADRRRPAAGSLPADLSRPECSVAGPGCLPFFGLARDCPATIARSRMLLQPGQPFADAIRGAFQDAVPRRRTASRARSAARATGESAMACTALLPAAVRQSASARLTPAVAGAAGGLGNQAQRAERAVEQLAEVDPGHIFHATLPPDFAMVPSGRTTVMPMSRSRGEPYR